MIERVINYSNSLMKVQSILARVMRSWKNSDLWSQNLRINNHVVLTTIAVETSKMELDCAGDYCCFMQWWIL